MPDWLSRCIASSTAACSKVTPLIDSKRSPTCRAPLLGPDEGGVREGKGQGWGEGREGSGKGRVRVGGRGGRGQGREGSGLGGGEGGVRQG